MRCPKNSPQRGAVVLESAIALALTVLMMLTAVACALAWMQAHDEQRALSDRVRRSFVPEAAPQADHLSLGASGGLVLGRSVRTPAAFAIWPQGTRPVGLGEESAADSETGGTNSEAAHPSTQTNQAR